MSTSYACSTAPILAAFIKSASYTQNITILCSISHTEGKISPTCAGSQTVVQLVHQICTWTAHTGISMAYACCEMKMLQQMNYPYGFKLKVIELAKCACTVDCFGVWAARTHGHMDFPKLTMLYTTQYLPSEYTGHTNFLQRSCPKKLVAEVQYLLSPAYLARCCIKVHR